LSDLQNEERKGPAGDVCSKGPERDSEPFILHAKDATIEQENGPFHEEVGPCVGNRDEEAKLKGSEL
jgi:hypothetical protein